MWSYRGWTRQEKSRNIDRRDGAGNHPWARCLLSPCQARDRYTHATRGLEPIESLPTTTGTVERNNTDSVRYRGRCEQRRHSTSQDADCGQAKRCTVEPCNQRLRGPRGGIAKPGWLRADAVLLCSRPWSCLLSGGGFYIQRRMHRGDQPDLSVRWHQVTAEIVPGLYAVHSAAAKTCGSDPVRRVEVSGAVGEGGGQESREWFWCGVSSGWRPPSPQWHFTISRPAVAGCCVRRDNGSDLQEDAARSNRIATRVLQDMTLV
jgi:hypothetical protein